jgi:hypothetical protein
VAAEVVVLVEEIFLPCRDEGLVAWDKILLQTVDQ